MTPFFTLKKEYPILLFVSLLFFSIPNSQAQFTDVTVDVGLNMDPPLDVLPIEHDGGDGTNPVDNMLLGSGVAWFDYNNDDYLDLYITMRTGANLLYENDGPDGNGDYSFTEVAATLGIQDVAGDGSGVAIADFDNDGFKDIYICNTNVDRLYKNIGGTFYNDVTGSAGLSTVNDCRSTTASWGDYDNDGYLDLYIARHMPHLASTNSDSLDLLYHNDGDGTFTDVSNIIGLVELAGLGFAGGWSDFDNDGDLDIILINDCNVGGVEYERTKIFRNDGGNDPVNDWTFTEVAASVGVDDCSNGMGIAIGDINHDGNMEFANSDIGPINLWKNTGGAFTDISTSAGVNDQIAGDYSWGICFIDHNLDGWLDLFVVSGVLWGPSSGFPQKNYLFENDGTTGEVFTDVSASMDMDDIERSRNGVFGDFDDDGDQDIALINYGEAVMLKQNNTSGNNWLKVKLTGDLNANHNLDAIGAKIKITTPDGISQYYEIKSGSNLGGGNDIVAYFGIGSNTIVTTVEVTWPGETTVGDTWYDEAANTVLVSIDGLGESPLPVELVTFNATAQDKNVLLEWETASETNNKIFMIQKSKNGRDFENIGSVAGVGTTTTFSFYSFIDKNPIDGNNYYRLEQIDFDGTNSFSDVELVRFDSPAFGVQIIPNPVFSSSFNIKIKNPFGKPRVEIFNLVGQVVYSEIINSTEREASIEIETRGWPKGIYFAKVNDGINQQTEKLILQ